MPLETPAGYAPLDSASLPLFLATLPEIAARLGGKPGDWKVSEVGDGNLNLVFIVRGPAGGVCVKQALPYVRLVGEGWPMPLKRAYFEHECLQEHGRHVGRLLPEVYHYEPPLYAIVMELLQPHIIMRRGMIQGIRYPRFAADIAAYMARSLFFTSDLALPAGEKKRKMAVFCDNTELCKITEDLIFTDPYMVHERNRWTKPQLDGIAAEFRADAELKLAISRLKLKFLASAEALIHGDLHTGSIMITESDTRIIDPEFAFFGPMGFDIGAVLGNLLMNFFSQDGHATPESPRGGVSAMGAGGDRGSVGQVSARNFSPSGATTRRAMRIPPRCSPMVPERFGWRRSVSATWIGCLPIPWASRRRRRSGASSAWPTTSISSGSRIRTGRALCETRALRLARDMMVHTDRYRDIGAVTAAARQVRKEIARLS